MTNHELDIKTATQIMGWHTVSKYSDPQPHQINIVDDNGQPITSAFEKQWSPSTDMNHAMQVVEKMVAAHKVSFLCARNWQSKMWQVEFGHQEPIHADTLPRGICIAALQWAEANKTTDEKDE